MIAFEAGRWEGVDGMGDELLAELRPKAEATVERVAMYFTGEVQKTLSGRRSGKPYRIGKRGRTHIASAPGEPPAVLTGRLRQSIGWSEPKWEGDTVSSEVGTNVVYARRLEFGGIDSRGVKIEARPYWAPTILRIEPTVERMFEVGL